MLMLESWKEEKDECVHVHVQVRAGEGVRVCGPWVRAWRGVDRTNWLA